MGQDSAASGRVALSPGRHAAGDDGGLGAYPEAIGQNKPRTRFLVASGTALQAGLQTTLEPGPISHSLQTFPAHQHRAWPLQVESPRQGFLRHRPLHRYAVRRLDHTASACRGAAASGSVAPITADGGCFGSDRHCLAPASLLMAEIEFPVLRMMSLSCASVSFRRLRKTLTCTRSCTSRQFRERVRRRIIIGYPLCWRGTRQAAFRHLTGTGDRAAPRETPRIKLPNSGNVPFGEKCLRQAASSRLAADARSIPYRSQELPG
jgi:hypothetical protein